jgi:hypothetical protein
MSFGASVADQAAKEIFGLIAVVLVIALLVGGLSSGMGHASGYARGYCHALDAAVVADSLCVRGDSIVAHIKEE